jgi:hypothetical protein
MTKVVDAMYGPKVREAFGFRALRFVHVRSTGVQ